MRWVGLGFFAGLEAFLGPFVAAVFAFVGILELFDVNDYRLALLNSDRSNGG